MKERMVTISNDLGFETEKGTERKIAIMITLISQLEEGIIAGIDDNYVPLIVIFMVTV